MSGLKAPEWRAVCAEESLQSGRLERLSLGRGPDGIPVTVLVGRSTDGDAYAYQNLCKHLPIPLDGGSGEFFGSDSDTLRCGTHGALYRVSDGYCTRGPCRGTSLRRFPLKIEDGTVWVLVGT